MTDLAFPSKGVAGYGRLHSVEIDQIAEALSQFQAQMPVLDKTGKNFTKGNAATIGDVVTVARRAAKYGLSFSQPVTKWVHVDRNSEYFVRTILYHKSGQWISGGELPIVVEKGGSAAFGAALTYARKYSLQATMGIADHNDDDIDWDFEPTVDGTDRGKAGSAKKANLVPNTAGQGGSSEQHLPTGEPPATNTMVKLDDAIPDFTKPNIEAMTPDELRQFFDGMGAEQARKEIAPIRDLNKLRSIWETVQPQDPDVVQAFLDQSSAIK